MMTESAIDVVGQYEVEPPSGNVDELLEAASSVDGLIDLTSALRESPRPWSATLIVLAALRLAATDVPSEAARLSSTAFDILKIVRPINDWPASAGCLDLMKGLAADRRLKPRDDTDRVALLEVLWQCASGEHPNARSAAVYALEAIYDFGDIAGLLGDDGVQELRRRIHDARSVTWESGVAEDLAAAERLLP